MTEEKPGTRTTGGRTLEITDVPEEHIRQIELRAQHAGTGSVEYIKRLIARDLETPTLDEILAPIRQGFAESGLTEDELTALFEEARDEVWDEWKREGKA